jgi:hypothetical protein
MTPEKFIMVREKLYFGEDEDEPTDLGDNEVEDIGMEDDDEEEKEEDLGIGGEDDEEEEI